MSDLTGKFITSKTAEEMNAAAAEIIRLGEHLFVLHNTDAFIRTLHEIRALPEKEAHA